LCEPFASAQEFRLATSRGEVSDWSCMRRDGAFACGGTGVAVCEVEERRVEESEVCE